MPGLTPKTTFWTACDVWQEANSKAASWSISLTARRPVVACIRIALALVTRPVAPTMARTVSTMKEGASDHVSGVADSAAL